MSIKIELNDPRVHLSDGVLVKYTTEASMLGFPPGKWPRFIETDMGNGLSLELLRVTEDGGLYKQINGNLTIVVFND